MATLLRRLASPTTFAFSPSTAGSSHFNGRPQQVPHPGQVQAQASFGASRFLQLSTMSIDMQVEGFISHTTLVQNFLSTDNSSTAEASCSFRLPNEAVVMFFKVEIGDYHAIEDESRPSKRARHLYHKALRSETPAAILREVDSGIFEANLGRIPPGVQVTTVIKFAECILSNVRGELMINYPALSPSAWSSSSDDTNISLKIEIIQEGLIHKISSPTHQKLLSIKAGVTSAAREVETFASLQQPIEEARSERPNQATVSLSATRRVLYRNFELIIETSDESQRTIASLSATNRFGHAVLVVSVRPCDLFSGEQDMQWSVDIELDHPWNRCSCDLREMNLTSLPQHEASSSPSKFQFVQSPKSIPKLSHRQRHSVFFLLDFGRSSEYFLDSVCITATSSKGTYPNTARLSVERTSSADTTLQKLCVSSILRDAHNSLKPRKPNPTYADGQSSHFSSLVKSAERLGQMYSLCNHWTSKIAVDSMCDSDDNTDSEGPQLYGDDLPRLVLPTHLSEEFEMISCKPTDFDQGAGLCVKLDSTPMPCVRSGQRGDDGEFTSNKAEDEQPEDDVDTVTPVRARLSDAIMKRNETPLIRKMKGKAPSSIQRYEWLPAPIKNSRSRMASPLEERPQYQPNSLDALPAYEPYMGPFNFNTLPQEIHLDEVDATNYSDYEPVDNANPITDPGLDSSPSIFQGVSSIDYQWDDIHNANQSQVPTSISNKELTMQSAAFSKAELCQAQVAPRISPTGQGNAVRYGPQSVAEFLKSFDGLDEFIYFPPTAEASPTPSTEPPLFSNEMPSIVNPLDAPVFSASLRHVTPSQLDIPHTFEQSMNPEKSSFSSKSIPVLTSDQPTYSTPTDNSINVQPPIKATQHANQPQQTVSENSSDQLESDSVSIHVPTTPRGENAFESPQQKTSMPYKEEIPQQKECQLAELWTQIKASQSANGPLGTYLLQADLRYRIESHFNSGTREWLVERIASSSSRENEPAGLEVVADTMLVLAYVKICIFDHYSEAQWHVGLILGYQRQKEIFEELVSRVVRSGDDDE